MKTEIILKEGYPYIAVSFAVFLLSMFVSDSVFWHIFWFGVFGFFVFFFRNPARVPESDSENAVISPTDGTITEITEALSPITKEETVKITVKLSLFDVHVQRSPITGEMSAREYIHGLFLSLNSPKASELNEQNRVLFENDKAKIVVNQIAGFITRRIVMFRELGPIKVTERYGMIMFGSQVDIYLPKNVELKVTEFQKIKAGESVIGFLNEEN
ncbi:MAG: phosphatidylserine decarboxylase family protein [Epsilonproteobacteria bacterium]|nr:phosphatidylserine decarboxylase family protein [Campylobacterota bacterium]